MFRVFHPPHEKTIRMLSTTRAVVTVDTLGLASLKDAANCETHSDVRNFVSKLIFEHV